MFSQRMVRKPRAQKYSTPTFWTARMSGQLRIPTVFGFDAEENLTKSDLSRKASPVAYVPSLKWPRKAASLSFRSLTGCHGAAEHCRLSYRERDGRELASAPQ